MSKKQESNEQTLSPADFLEKAIVGGLMLLGAVINGVSEYVSEPEEGEEKTTDSSSVEDPNATKHDTKEVDDRENDERENDADEDPDFEPVGETEKKETEVTEPEDDEPEEDVELEEVEFTPRDLIYDSVMSMIESRISDHRKLKSPMILSTI